MPAPAAVQDTRRLAQLMVVAKAAEESPLPENFEGHMFRIEMCDARLIPAVEEAHPDDPA